jgi:biotin carboxyl carrier protein
MKYIVNVADKSYEVEIEDIFARPIIARVGGQEFEVNPENNVHSESPADVRESKPVEVPKQAAHSNSSIHELTAPLPGTIIELFIKPGDSLEAGQVILVIEAMKMKNSIRSTRAGKVAEVLVSAGQTVTHKQALVKFED